MKQSNYLDFSNQHIYVGLDVHHKSWTVSIVINGTLAGRFVQEPDPLVLLRYLKKNYPNGIYHCAYEAGFCGFWIHEILLAHGGTVLLFIRQMYQRLVKKETGRPTKLIQEACQKSGEQSTHTYLCSRSGTL